TYFGKGNPGYHHSTFKTIVQALAAEPARIDPTFSAITRLINKTLIERDFSAQEVCWLLLEGPLVRSSAQKNFKSINLNGDRAINYDRQTGEIGINDSVVQAYASRTGHNETSLYDFVAFVSGPTTRRPIC